MQKLFVDIIVKMTKEGVVLPIKILWEDGRVFEIDKIVNIRRAVSIRSGGYGIRYLCIVKNRRIFLFLEDNKWFLERAAY